MTNFERFNQVEANMNKEMEKLRDVAKIEDTYKMCLEVEAQVERIKKYKSAIATMIEDFSGKWDDEYKKSPLEELGMDWGY